MTPKVYMMVAGEYAEIAPSGIIVVEPRAPVTLDATIHFVVHERTEILIAICALFNTGPAIYMSCHHGHILQVAFTPLVADRTVVGMIKHQPLNSALAELYSFRVIDRNTDAVRSGGHTGHDYASARVVLIFELFDSTLPAGAYGMHGGMPAEIGQVEPEREACMQEVLPVFYLIWFVIYEDGWHLISTGSVRP